MLHRKTTKTTGPQNTIARITKSIHPRVVEGRKRKWEGKWHREKKYSNQSRHRGWQMLEKSCRKTCGPFRLTGVKNPHIGIRKIVPSVHQKQSQFFREKGICIGPLAEWVLPSLLGEVNKKRAAQPPPNPTHPLWMADDSVACSSLQFGRRWMW